jgi:CxxC motif-containing protein
MEIKRITCTICPVGCRAEVSLENGKISKIEHIECPQGKEYVEKEIEAPVRDFFTTVRVEGASIPMLPVRADKPVPKEKIRECSLELAKITVNAPVKVGDVIAENLLGLGVNIRATRGLKLSKTSIW